MSGPLLLGICGALRAGSYNRMLMHEAARAFGGRFETGDIRFPLYDGDLEDREGVPEAVARLAEQISRADAVAIASPEYNKSIPGVLKNALDWLSRLKGPSVWQGKPVALLAAADGREGGARGQFALRLAMTPFRPRLLTGPEVLVAKASSEFDAEGRLLSESYRKALTELMAALREEAMR
jgi:chromate reductase